MRRETLENKRETTAVKWVGEAASSRLEAISVARTAKDRSPLDKNQDRVRWRDEEVEIYVERLKIH